MKAIKPSLPPFLRGLTFTYQRPEKDSPYPNNCPVSREFKDPSGKVVAKIEDATKKYEMLGFYPVYKTLRWGFDEDPNFDWKTYWEWQCDMDQGAIKPREIVENLDKMHRDNLGDLDTGATTLMGYIGQKAIREGEMDLATDIFSRTSKFSDFVDSGLKDKAKFKGVTDKGDRACESETGDRRSNCDDTQSRSFLAIGMMAAAAVEKGMIKDNPDPKLVKKEVKREDLGPAPDPSAFKADPYKVGSEYLLRCMVESENDTLKRDQCTESIKDVMFSAFKANHATKDPEMKEKTKRVFTDMLTHLNQYYIIKDNKLVDAETWVNTTVWKADALIDALLTEEKTKEKNELTDVLLKDGLISQLKEETEEFSAATWSGEQVLNIMANIEGGSFNRHDEIVRNLLNAKDPKGKFRINVWNGWIKPYLDKYKPSGIKEKVGGKEESFPANSHTPDQKTAMKAVIAAANTGCLIPTITNIRKDTSGTEAQSGINVDAIENCTGAVSEIIKKSDDEEVLWDALNTYFYYGQGPGLGFDYNETIAKKIQEAIDKRFNLDFTSKLSGSMIYETVGNIGEEEIKEDPTLKDFEGWGKTIVLAGILSKRGKEDGRFYKKEGNNFVYRKYAFEHLTPPKEAGKEPITRIILSGVQ